MTFGVTKPWVWFSLLTASKLGCGPEQMNLTSLSLSLFVNTAYFIYHSGLLRRFVK